MTNSKNNIHKPEAFEEIIRKKLENHSIPVDDSIWAGIEARINKKNQKLIPFWWWFSGGAAVAILALLFTIQSFNHTESYYSNKPEQKQKQEILPQKNKMDTVSESKKVFQIEKRIQKQLIAKAENKGVEQKTVVPDNAALKIDSSESKKAVSDSIKSHAVEEKTFTQIEDKQTDTTSIEKKQEIYPAWENNIAGKKANKTSDKKNDGLLLAASLSAGSQAPTGTMAMDNIPLYANKNIVSAETSFSSVMTPNDFSRIIYSTPVSVGFVVQKPIAQNWKLESGLVYTYLSTTFQNSGVQQNDANMHLHYIGIPLNIIAQVSKTPKWEFYISSGGMIEKGIRSIYIQHEYYGNQTITTTASTNIAGLQWSINGAIGTTYKLNQNLGIYFEPKISYFFNNNQPVSARTDQPVSIGLTAGIRFQLK